MLAGTIADRIGGTLGRLLFLSVVLVLAGTGVYAIVDAVVSMNALAIVSVSIGGAWSRPCETPSEERGT